MLVDAEPTMKYVVCRLNFTVFVSIVQVRPLGSIGVSEQASDQIPLKSQ